MKEAKQKADELVAAHGHVHGALITVNEVLKVLFKQDPENCTSEYVEWQAVKEELESRI